MNRNPKYTVCTLFGGVGENWSISSDRVYRFFNALLHAPWFANTRCSATGYLEDNDGNEVKTRGGAVSLKSFDKWVAAATNNHVLNLRVMGKRSQESIWPPQFAQLADSRVGSFDTSPTICIVVAVRVEQVDDREAWLKLTKTMAEVTECCHGFVEWHRHWGNAFGSGWLRCICDRYREYPGDGFRCGQFGPVRDGDYDMFDEKLFFIKPVMFVRSKHLARPISELKKCPLLVQSEKLPYGSYLLRFQDEVEDSRELQNDLKPYFHMAEFRPRSSSYDPDIDNP